MLTYATGEPVLLDFERCKHSAVPQNILQVVSFFFPGFGGKGASLIFSLVRAIANNCFSWQAQITAWRVCSMCCSFSLIFFNLPPELKYSKLVFRKASKVGANTCFSWQAQLLRQRSSAFVSILLRQHTSAYVACFSWHTSAYVACFSWHTSACVAC